MKISTLALALCLLEAPAFAEPAPTPSPKSDIPKTDIMGSFDFYYLYNGNRPTVSGSSTQNALRAFDRYHNQLMLNLAELGVKRTQGEVSFKAELIFGDMVDALNPKGDSLTRYLGQALLTYSPAAVPGLSFTVGKGYSHLGLELTRARDNWQYSRSFIYYSLPLWHTGLNAAYTILPGQLTAGLYLYNDTNTVVESNNDKELGAQLGWIPLQGLTLYYNFLTGAENPGDDRTRRIYHNLNALWSVTENHSVAIDTLFANQTGGDSFNAVAFSTRHQMMPGYYFSPRVEYFNDASGLVTSQLDNRLIGLTLAQGFELTRGLDARVELRNDSSNHEYFQKGDGSASRSQFTVSTAILYGF